VKPATDNAPEARGANSIKFKIELRHIMFQTEHSTKRNDERRSEYKSDGSGGARAGRRPRRPAGERGPRRGRCVPGRGPTPAAPAGPAAGGRTRRGEEEDKGGLHDRRKGKHCAGIKHKQRENADRVPLEGCGGIMALMPKTSVNPTILRLTQRSQRSLFRWTRWGVRWGGFRP